MSNVEKDKERLLNIIENANMADVSKEELRAVVNTYIREYEKCSPMKVYDIEDNFMMRKIDVYTRSPRRDHIEIEFILKDIEANLKLLLTCARNDTEPGEKTVGRIKLGNFSFSVSKQRDEKKG